jgi:hypothetical protein
MIPALHGETGINPALGALTGEQLAAVREFEARALTLAQLPFATWHHFHAGLYSRTMMVPRETVLTGALVKIDTVLTVSGDITISGVEYCLRVTGYRVIPCKAGRKNVFVAHADTWMTMQFATAAATVEDAEAEFTDEAHMLASRYNQNFVYRE